MMELERSHQGRFAKPGRAQVKLLGQGISRRKQLNQTAERSLEMTVPVWRRQNTWPQTQTHGLGNMLSVLPGQGNAAKFISTPWELLRAFSRADRLLVSKKGSRMQQFLQHTQLLVGEPVSVSPGISVQRRAQKTRVAVLTSRVGQKACREGEQMLSALLYFRREAQVWTAALPGDINCL